MVGGAKERPAEGGRTLLRLFNTYFIGEVAIQAVAFLIGAYLARVLSRDAFGAWAFATSILAFLAVFAEGGTEVWGGREISTNPSSLRPSVIGVLRLRSVLALLAAFVLSMIAITTSPAQRWVLVLGAGSLAAVALQTTWAHRALHSSAPPAVMLVQRLMMFGLVILLVRHPDQAGTVTLLQGVTDVAAALLLLVLLVPRFRRVDAGRAPDLRALAFDAAPLGAARLLRNLPPTMATVLLGYLLPIAEVGEFGAALRIAVLLLIVAAVFNVVTFPVIARASQRGGEGEVRVVCATLRLLLLLIAPICIGGILVSEPLLRVTFTSDYVQATSALQILFVGFAAQSLSDSLRRILHARRRASLDLARVLLATALTFIIGPFAIPPWGATGAAFTIALGEIILLGLAWHSLRSTLPAREVWSIARSSLMPALLMGIAVFPLRELPVAVPILSGFAFYAGMIWLRRRSVQSELRTLDEFGPS